MPIYSLDGHHALFAILELLYPTSSTHHQQQRRLGIIGNFQKTSSNSSSLSLYYDNIDHEASTLRHRVFFVQGIVWVTTAGLLLVAATHVSSILLLVFKQQQQQQ